MVHHMHKPLPLPNAGKVKLIHFPKATLSREIFSGNVVCIREKQHTPVLPWIWKHFRYTVVQTFSITTTITTTKKNP